MTVELGHKRAHEELGVAAEPVKQGPENGASKRLKGTHEGTLLESSSKPLANASLTTQSTGLESQASKVARDQVPRDVFREPSAGDGLTLSELAALESEFKEEIAAEEEGGQTSSSESSKAWWERAFHKAGDIISPQYQLKLEGQLNQAGLIDTGAVPELAYINQLSAKLAEFVVADIESNDFDDPPLDTFGGFVPPPPGRLPTTLVDTIKTLQYQHIHINGARKPQNDPTAQHLSKGFLNVLKQASKAVGKLENPTYNQVSHLALLVRIGAQFRPHEELPSYLNDAKSTLADIGIELKVPADDPWADKQWPSEGDSPEAMDQWKSDGGARQYRASVDSDDTLFIEVRSDANRGSGL